MAETDSEHKDWHHAPAHRLGSSGAYMVTCGTLGKEPFLNTEAKLSDFESLLFKYAAKFGWNLQAWAIMSNHYHWIGISPENCGDAGSLKLMVSQLHEVSTKRLNRIDNAVSRRVWYNYWESHITYRTSYYARLKYIHNNPVHHGLVKCASNYRWCSRAWLEMSANRGFIKQIDSFKTDLLNVPDDF
jgi:putative transposase